MSSSIRTRIAENRLLLATQPVLKLSPGMGVGVTQDIRWSRVATRVIALSLLMALAWFGIAAHTRHLEAETERLIAASSDLRL
jgi:hypothetical protein